MRLKAGKCEYTLPADFHKLESAYVKVGKAWYWLREVPPTIPAGMDTSDLIRREQGYREKHPGECIPVMVTIRPPRRGKRNLRLEVFPAPSKAFALKVRYFCQREV